MTRDDLHSAAEKFLREYLSQTGSEPESVQPVSRAPRATHVTVSQTAASDFIKRLRRIRQAEADATNVERYEIEEPQKLILCRRSSRCVSYFYGFKRGLPVFTHDKALATAINTADSDGLASSLLEKHNVETFALPAPELRRGSL